MRRQDCASGPCRMATGRCIVALVASLVGLAGGWLPSSAQPTLTWLGGFGGSESVANHLTPDGSVVVGFAQTSAGRYRAFRWTAATGMQDLIQGSFTGSDGRRYDQFEANAVSPNGNVVVGAAFAFSGGTTRSRAFVWRNGTMSDLGTLGGRDARALDIVVTPDGTEVILGEAQDSRNVSLAVRWVNGQIQNLGRLPDAPADSPASATGASGDGRIVVGVSAFPNRAVRGFRWENGQMTPIDPLAGDRACFITGISRDGNVIFGYSIGARPRPFRVVGGGTPEPLPLLLEDMSAVLDATADGSILVGYSGAFAVRWTDAGVEDLNQVYANLLQPGERLEAAHAISPDGRYIAGYGYRPVFGEYVAFLLDTGPRCTPHNGDVDNNGCINDADLLAILNAFGQSGSNLGRADADCNGVVNDDDLLIILSNYGQGC